jgi:transposase-like protein
LFAERGFDVDHSTINRWVLAYAPEIEKRLRQFRRPHCGSIRVDETYVKIRGEWPSTSTAFPSIASSRPGAISTPPSGSSARL